MTIAAPPNYVDVPRANAGQRLAGHRRRTDAPKDYLSVIDLSHESLVHVLDLAATLKRERAAGVPGDQPLAGKHIGLLFEKQSLRTIATFTIGIRELGGDVIEPSPDVAFGGRETVQDLARNLERWVEAVVVRTYQQSRLRAFAAATARLRVINALTDEEHPCQALADMMTLRERFGDVKGRTIAFVGDGNNVATSLTQAALMLGMHVRVGSPVGFDLPERVVEGAVRHARHNATLTLCSSPFDAVAGVDAVYTDAWTSMGQEAETEKRNAAFQAYQVNAALMAEAAPHALFMHCLPAHRGEEVTDEVMDSPASVVFDQAENRLHAQKALLTLMMGQ